MQVISQSEKYSKVTHDILVTVTPEFLPEKSSPQEGVYAYSYDVTFENLGTKNVQLVNRHWVVMSGGRQIADVKGEGVIGEKPILQPSETYYYSSWTLIRDEIGSMLGSYTFVDEDGNFFDVAIPEFHLIYTEQSFIH